MADLPGLHTSHVGCSLAIAVFQSNAAGTHDATQMSVTECAKHCALQDAVAAVTALPYSPSKKPTPKATRDQVSWHQQAPLGCSPSLPCLADGCLEVCAHSQHQVWQWVVGCNISCGCMYVDWPATHCRMLATMWTPQSSLLPQSLLVFLRCLRLHLSQPQLST